MVLRRGPRTFVFCREEAGGGGGRGEVTKFMRVEEAGLGWCWK